MTFAPLDTLEAPAAVSVLRLHTDASGHVWHGADGGLGEDSGCWVDDFFDRAPYLGIDLGRVEKVRLLGAADNAPLVVQLHHRCLQLERRPRIQVCSPALCPGPAERVSPERVLHALWQPRPGGSAHWHDLSERDYAAYAVVAALKENDGRPNEKALRILQYHPAWPALSFPAGCDPHYGCLLVALIVDPRWFRDPIHPHRLSRLRAYLGVTPQNALACYGGTPGGRHYDRFVTALYAWCGRTSGWGGKSKNDPHQFLVRAGLRGGGGEAEAALRATGRFLRFVAEVWLDNVCYGHRDGGFRPEQFFKTEAETDGYRHHLASLKSRGL